MFVARTIQHAEASQCIKVRVNTLGSVVTGRAPPYPGVVEEEDSELHEDLSRKLWVHHLEIVTLKMIQ